MIHRLANLTRRIFQMKNFTAGIVALGLIAATSSAFAAEGEYYQDVEVNSNNVDPSHTGSIAARDGMQIKTSRDNRLPFDQGSGSYYEGAQRPR